MWKHGIFARKIQNPAAITVRIGIFNQIPKQNSKKIAFIIVLKI